MDKKINFGKHGKIWSMEDNGVTLMDEYEDSKHNLLFLLPESQRLISRTYGDRKDFILFPSTWTLYKRFVKNHKGEWFYLGGKSDEPCMINVSLVNEFLNNCSAKVSFKDLKDLFNKVGGLL